jgi:hypothetical protein
MLNFFKYLVCFALLIINYSAFSRLNHIKTNNNPINNFHDLDEIKYHVVTYKDIKTKMLLCVTIEPTNSSSTWIDSNLENIATKKLSVGKFRLKTAIRIKEITYNSHNSYKTIHKNNFYQIQANEEIEILIQEYQKSIASRYSYLGRDKLINYGLITN